MRSDRTRRIKHLTHFAGLVHLHHHPSALHPEIDGGILLSLLYPRPRFSLPCHFVPQGRC